MHYLPDSLKLLASQVKLLILDVDGVLTDGTLSYTEAGEEVKHFNSKDGFGIRMLLENGIQVAVITARDSGPLDRRMKDLGIHHYFKGEDNKLAAFERLIQELNLHPEEVAYAGDDLLDVPVMRRVGFPVSVHDGHWVAKQNAVWVTDLNGGRGAVREIADALLVSRGELRDFYERFLSEKVGVDDSNTKL